LYSVYARRNVKVIALFPAVGHESDIVTPVSEVRHEVDHHTLCATRSK
jgi:hypothetical protein